MGTETARALEVDPARSASTRLADLRPVVPTSPSCEECLAPGRRWVHRNDSPGRRATAHWNASRHSVIRSLEPGESWGWCYADEVGI